MCDGLDCVQEREWSSYFDYILIDANKPRFFAEGNTLREIDPVSIKNLKKYRPRVYHTLLPIVKHSDVCVANFLGA